VRNERRPVVWPLAAAPLYTPEAIDRSLRYRERVAAPAGPNPMIS
jgi:hypothetical protein